MSHAVIVNVSLLDTLRIRMLAIVLGVWIIVKRFSKWAWNPSAFFSIEMRDSPPNCLVDTTLGQHKYVKLKGVKFHYVEAGGGGGRPLVVLLHGFPDCWLSWRFQINALGEHFRVVALDLKGFGDSDKPAKRSAYRIEAILEELRQFIHSLGATRCTVIGHDLGALLGWYLVHREPELVEKFVSVACPHPNLYWQTSDHAYFNSQWLKFIQLPYLPEIDAMKEDINVISDHFHHLRNNGKKNTYLEAYKYAFSRKEDWTGPINYYRNLPFTRISEESAQIKTSTLLVTGNSKAQYVRLEGVVQSTDYCEKFHVKIVDGAGHFPHQENPAVFNEVVLKFLKVPTIAQKQVGGRSPSQGLIGHLFGAVSNTVKYGNSVIDSVQKKTSMPATLARVK